MPAFLLFAIGVSGYTAALTAFGRHTAVIREHFTLFRREKFIHRETETTEKLAGIFPISAAAAFLFRKTDIVRRHDQLDISLQLDDAELAQSGIELSSLPRR